MTYITAAAPATIGKVYGILIQVNTALVGTITITDDGVTKAVITNPSVQQLRYYGFSGSVVITPNATCDVTVSALNHQD